MQFKDIIQKRRSVRYFDGQPIPKETLVEIIKDAQRTPSWANSQPWQVYIATGETLENIKKEHYLASTQGLRGQAEFSTMHRGTWAAKPQKNMGNWSGQIQSYLASDNILEFGSSQQDLFRAGAIVYLTLPVNSSAWSIFDLGAFSQTLMYSAVDKGVGTMSAYETVKYPDIVRKWMGIPESETVAMGIALGYPDERKINGFVSDRVPIDDMLTIKN